MENKKSINELAFSDYISDCQWKKSKKNAKIFGGVCAALGMVAYYLITWYVLKWHDIISVKICFVVYVTYISYVLGISLFLIFVRPIPRDKTKQEMLSLLSHEERKNIVAAYIEKETLQHQKNINYLESVIKPSQDAIKNHIVRIEELNDELKTIKNKKL